MSTDEDTRDQTAVPSAEDAVARVRAEAARYAAEDDPSRRTPVERRLRLLWDPPEPSVRGRPPRFTLADVVRAGVRVADELGLTDLSMRKVAEALGTRPMSLYTYVESREELIELMIDAVYGETEPPSPGGPWREALRQVALGRWARYRAHPWLLELNLWRQPLGPHVMDDEEAGYAALVDSGLTPTQVVDVLTVLDGYLQGAARAADAEARDERATGLTATDHWSARSSFWWTYFDPARYPAMTRLYLSGAFERESAEVEPGLDHLLDAVQVVIDGRAAPA